MVTQAKKDVFCRVTKNEMQPLGDRETERGKGRDAEMGSEMNVQRGEFGI